MGRFSSRILLAAVLCSLSLGRAMAIDAHPYGFVLINGIEQWGRANILDVPTLAVSRADADAKGTFNDFAARQTRFGVTLDAGTQAGAAVTGVIEADFWGNRATGSASNDTPQSGPRIRLANLTLQWEHQALVIGQDWTQAFAPLRPTSLVHQAVPALSSSGHLWNRLTQVRWEGNLPAGGANLGAKVALVRSFSSDQAGRLSTSTVAQATQLDQAGSGESSGWPAAQALLEISRKTDNGRWAFGVSGQYLRERFSAGFVPAPAGATTNTTEGYLGAVHAVAPLFSWLEISGEGFSGRSDQNLQGLGQVYDDNGRVRTSLTRGGFGQLTLKPCKGWKLNAAYGGEHPDAAGLASGAVRDNRTVTANVIWEMSKELSWTLEYGAIHTKYVGKSEGYSQSLGIGSMLKF